MVGFAAILSNLGTDEATPVIKVFSNTTAGTLNLQVRTQAERKKRFDLKHDFPSLEPSAITNPSTLSVARYMGMLLVVASTNAELTGETRTPSANYSHISIVSPVYKRLPDVRVQSDRKSVTICSDTLGQDAWIYYLNKGTDRPLSMYEFRVGGNKPESMRDLGNVGAGSSLASYFAEGKRYVIYQATDGLREYCVNEHNSTRIDSTQQASPNASFGVTYTSDRAEVYLYFTAEETRIIKLAIKKNNRWGQSAEDLDNDFFVDQDSQVSVVHHKDANYIFYSENSDGTMVQRKDSTFVTSASQS